MNAPLQIDILGHAQDQLMIQLCAGRMSVRRLNDAHARHVAELMRAGFSFDAATAAFWDAVAAARTIHEEGNA
jgi:hypothetical protein